MFRKLWKFLLDEKNQKALKVIGGVISAIAVACWALWQHFCVPLKTAPKGVVEQSPQFSGPSAKSGNNGAAVVATDRAKVTIKQIITDRDSSRPASKPPLPEEKPTSHRAESGDKGISVNASDSSEVKIHREGR